LEQRRNGKLGKCKKEFNKSKKKFGDKMSKKPLTIGFVSSYIPRECGIATFTNNLKLAIESADRTVRIKIIAMNDAKYKYPEQVVTSIDQNDDKSYVKAAEFINKSDIDVVSVQHEFGIFGGFNGNKLLILLKHLKKPVVMTMHTVPISTTRPIPLTAKRKKSRTKLIRKMFPYVQKIDIMIQTSKEFLHDHMDIPNSHIDVIPHGAPKISGETLNNYKKLKTSLGFEKDDFVLTTFGLIAPKKGLEFVVQALPKIIKKNPGVKIKYLIAGRMHPKKPKIYLENLKKMAKDLGVDKNVIFDNRYLTFSEIYKYLANTNIYITPYYTKEQSSSGTLSYAIATGRCIVSTPYVFAREMIERKHIGELADFKSSNSIAVVVNKLIKNPDLLKKHEEKSYELGKTIYWDKVGQAYIDSFKSVLK
jgi:glycosyltransferase involved in cell wall biosynthesis